MDLGLSDFLVLFLAAALPSGVISLTLSLPKFHFCLNWGCTVPLSGLCNGALRGTQFSFSVTVSTGGYEVIDATGWSESACGVSDPVSVCPFLFPCCF